MLIDIEFGRDGVICTYAGETNLLEVLEAFRQYLTHPNCSDFKYIVHNFSDIGSFEYSDEQFADMASYAIDNLQGGDYTPRCAVTDNETVKRCLELYSVITGRKWEFFSSVTAACEWVNSR